MSELPAWIVASTHPHKEAAAAGHLANQGFASYCPVVRKRVSHARKVRSVLRPLFPGYVFIELPSDERPWRPILSTYGIRSIVCSGDEPSRLDPNFIAALRAREEDGVIIAPTHPYQVGQHVRVADGPFYGTIATILSMGEKDRLVVLMDILNRPVRVLIDYRQVTSV